MSEATGIDRRRLLLGGSVAVAGAATALGVDKWAATPPAPATPVHGGKTIRFHGAHQPGIEMSPQAHQALVALDLKPTVDRDGLRRMLRILTSDAEHTMAGKPALADPEAELATVPARLTVTVGFGARPVELVRGTRAVPEWLGPLPAFSVDRLQDRWNGGDLLLQVASDDPVTVAHTVRMLAKDCLAFATVRWQQTGFRRAYGSEPNDTTMRNLFGQVDGTANPRPGSSEFAETVWRDDDWLDGGTTFVIRRIELLQDKWDLLDRTGRESAVGRRLSNGAPLTGRHEHDQPDFAATTAVGFPVIAEFAHIRRARGDGSQKIFRRGYNYDDGPAGQQASQGGLLFTSFQRDVTTQFVPMQQRIADLDLLNEWVTPIGSAVFAIPPGVQRGGMIGETLFG